MKYLPKSTSGDIRHSMTFSCFLVVRRLRPRDRPDFFEDFLAVVVCDESDGVSGPGPRFEIDGLNRGYSRA